jgi:hypothetical protein
MLTRDDLNWLGEFKPIDRPKLKKTFFDVGLRGHFENPTSDILAFYLNPNEEHGLGTLVQRALLKALKLKAFRQIDLPATALAVCEREWRLSDKKRMDIVLSTCLERAEEVAPDDWVIAIEVKVYAPPENDFATYKKGVEAVFKNVKESNRLFCVLAPGTLGGKIDKDWPRLRFSVLAKYIENELTAQPSGGEATDQVETERWRILLHEFTKQMILLDPEIGALKMDREKVEEQTQYHLSNNSKFMAVFDSFKRFREDFWRECATHLQETFNDESVDHFNQGGWTSNAEARAFWLKSDDVGKIWIMLPFKDSRRENLEKNCIQVRYLLTRDRSINPFDGSGYMSPSFNEITKQSDTVFACFANAFDLISAKALLTEAAEQIINFRKSARTAP